MVRMGQESPGEKFLSEAKGLVPWTWWPQDKAGHTGELKGEVNALFGKDTSFDTPKPERLIERIIHIATNPGDLVLDSFLGSGTTAAVAHKMGRRYIGIEMGTVHPFSRASHVRRLTLRRFWACPTLMYFTFSTASLSFLGFRRSIFPSERYAPCQSFVHFPPTRAGTYSLLCVIYAVLAIRSIPVQVNNFRHITAPFYTSRSSNAAQTPAAY